MGKNEKQESYYRINAQTGDMIIDVALDGYVDFFHEWDNAVFKKRDMHPELAGFLDWCSADIPIRKNLEIVFWVRNQDRLLETERHIHASYLNYYRYLERVENLKIRKNFERGLLMLFISLGLILCRILLPEPVTDAVWSRVLMEGLLIGGWVFMWEALHVVFFEGGQPFKRRQEIRRFLRAAICFSLESDRES